MGSTAVLFKTIECLFFGFGSWLCRVSTLFCLLRVRFRGFHLALNTRLHSRTVFYAQSCAAAAGPPVDDITLLA